MTFVLRIALFGLALVSLMTWMLVHSFVPKIPVDIAVERAAVDVEVAESNLRSDMLAARAGLLQDYDPLVRDIDALRKWSEQLQANLEDHTAAGDRGRALAAMVDEKEEVLERFKSDNAILQNAFATFDLLSARLTRAHVDPNLALAVGALASIVTHLARGPSSNVAQAAKLWLDALSNREFPPEYADDARSLALHGRMLIELVPRVDGLLERQQRLATGPLTREILEHIRRLREHRQLVSRFFNLALYATALVISVLFLRAGFGLRKRTQELQNRILIETAIVRASNLFVACPAEDIDARIGDALGLLGKASDADRAYVMTIAETEAAHLWCDPRSTAPAGWPNVCRGPLMSAVAGLRSFRRNSRDPALPGQLSARLLEEGMMAISCAQLWRDEEFVGLVGFERSRPAMLGLDAVSLDIVADVIGAALLRRDAYRRRAELERKLRRAERLEAVGTFASGIAHNFNNVLGVILGQSEMASSALDPRSVAASHINQIAEAGQRARDIASQILDFGRIEQGQPDIVDVAALVADAVHYVEASHPDDEVLAPVQIVKGVYVLAEAAQLQQVFVNVAQNAVQASTAGAEVSVVVDRQVVEARRVTHGELEPGSYVRVAVTDRGRGMDEAERAKMFEPFFTTREGGTGLGLATARDTVSEIGGAFDIRSAPGQGTKVEIWLPEASPLHGAESTSGTVLVLGIDRDSIQRDEDLLAALGYEPVGFTDAGAALRALRDEANRFDVVIVDQRTFKQGSGEFVRSLRTILPRGRPLVLASSEDERDPAFDAIGVSAVLKRPWRSTAVAVALARASGGCQATRQTTP